MLSYLLVLKGLIAYLLLVYIDTENRTHFKKLTVQIILTILLLYKNLINSIELIFGPIRYRFNGYI